MNMKHKTKQRIFKLIKNEVAEANCVLLQGAEAWLKDTNTSLDLFLDPDRTLYSLLGLGRSVAKEYNYSN